jgi:hypothetical protein
MGKRGKEEGTGGYSRGELGERVAYSLEIWWGTASDRSQGVKSWLCCSAGARCRCLVLGYLGGCAEVTVSVGAGLLGTVLRIV